MSQEKLLSPSPTISFADVAHQTLLFDLEDSSAKLVLELIDTAWVQRLRRIRQTGNTHLVYMFAEHSRFGHSLGVAYLSLLLMKKLERFSAEQIAPFRDAVAAAALLHDIGHTAPGSHLAARIWSAAGKDEHESISARVIAEDDEISAILDARDPGLKELVLAVLTEHEQVPPWTHSIISGGGWNADRGNWTIVDSAMCSVSYGRYNVAALIDAFRLSNDGKLILLESRLDAFSHFFVARDSMYRQVYLHRVMQGADILARNIARRVRDIASSGDGDPLDALAEHGVFCDETLKELLLCNSYSTELPLQHLFRMTEEWWGYHLSRWVSCDDQILRDLAARLRDRRLFKTVRLIDDPERDQTLIRQAKSAAEELGFDPTYYVGIISEPAISEDAESENMPAVLRDDGTLVPIEKIEPLVRALGKRGGGARSWLVVPKKVKEKLGRSR
ncbi:MAG: HD domain-containing protein [Bdellovibrionales bacterium]|nr:HD domain-containing protein [Bdellovibrionales bacterium]